MVSGYGKILYSYLNFSKTDLNFFELNLFGNIVFILIGYFLTLSIGLSVHLNFFLAIMGTCLYFFYKKELNLVSLKKILAYLLLFFSLLLISKTHEDFTSYHIQTINNIFYNKLTLGDANININMAHSSIFSYVQALYFLPFFESKLIHVPVFLVYFSTLGYFYLILKKQDLKKEETFFVTFIIFVLIIKFTRLSEYGYDYIAQFVILILFHKLFFQNNFIEGFNKSILLFVFSVSIKVISLFAFPFIILGLNKKIFKNISYKFVFIIFLMGSILISNSFIRTGCVFYPANFTCFDQNEVSWSVKKEIKNHSRSIELWSKGFMHQNKKSENYISSSKKYLNNYNWVNNWIDVHFFYKVFEYLLISIFVYFLLLLSFKEKIIFFNFDKKIIITLLLSGFSTFIWFNFAPQFRFGFAIFTILAFFTLKIFISGSLNINKKLFSYLLIILLIIFNLRNIVRINKEIDRLDLYQYKSFPWINKKILEKNFSYKKEKILDKSFYRIVLK